MTVPHSPLSLVDPFTGIVTYLVELEMFRSDPNVFVTTSSTADLSVYGFPTTAIINGSAAGLSATAAYGATIGECAERYACCVLHPEDLIYGSYRELLERGYSPVHPEKWALFDRSQYQSIPYTAFDPETPVTWIKAEHLNRREEQLVPACLVYLCSPKEFQKEGCHLIGAAVSTGAACGRSRAQALLKGFCEVVERDAYIIMWRNRLARPRVKIDTRSSIYALFNEKFKRPGLEYVLIHTTLDLALPSFFGILIDRRRNPPALVVGGAASLDPNTAALKTLLELVQGLKWIDSTEGQSFQIEDGFKNIRCFEDRVKLYSLNHFPEAFSFILEGQDEIELSSIPSLDTGDLPKNLQYCYKLVRERELDILALDLTTVDLQAAGLYVTKVMIPQCQPIEGDHLAQFLGGNRWREVPKRLGLSTSNASIETVNPWPHPYP